MNPNYTAIIYEQQAGVATITLNNPSKRNALDQAMRADMQDALARIVADRSVRAVVLTGAGGQFCSGGDISGMQGGAERTAQDWREGMQDLHLWVRQLSALDRPVIAAVDGAAYGAGFSLALAADFVLATPSARFCMSFMRIGLIPDCGAFYTLPRVVGVQRAKELFITAREVRAPEAKDLGIVMEIHEPDRLLARAQAMAAALAQASPVGVSMIKRAMGELGGSLDGLLDLEASAQGVAGGTPAHRQAVQAFLNKQAPAYVWPAPDA